jgi:hypothetical protein
VRAPYQPRWERLWRHGDVLVLDLVTNVTLFVSYVSAAAPPVEAMTRNVHLSSLLTLVVVSAALCTPLTASAEEPTAQVTPARQLFVDGRKLAQDGNYAAACPKFEESLRLEVGVGTQFNLADCWEHIGRTASARALFLGAAASAKAVGQSDREQVLRERAAALEPRLSRVVVEVLAKDPKVIVKRGDLPLESEDWGKAVPMDPGKYTISARAPGKRTWEKQIEVTASVPVVTVQVPELEDEAPAKPAAAAAATKPIEHKAVPATPPPSSPASDRGWNIDYRVVSLAGFGLAAVTVGVVTGIQYNKRNDDAKAICPSSRDCTVKQIQNHDRLVDEAKTKRAWSYAGFGVGAASFAGAAALWLFDRRKPTSAAAGLEAAPLVAVDGSVGATLSGSF